MNYWLMKSEPSTFSITDLEKKPRKTECWDGVRNYQARNFLCQMKKGDRAFFYHSSCEVPAIVGEVEIVKEAYPDPSQFDRKSKYFDANSSEEKPRWFMVDVKLVEIFKEPITLSVIRQNPKIKDFILTKRGSRLSVMPVSADNWGILKKLQ